MNPNTPPLTLKNMHPPCFALQAQMKKHTTDGLAASTRASSRLHAVSWQWKASHKMCSSVRVFWNACSERYHRPLDCSSSWLVTMETHFRCRLSRRQCTHTYMYELSAQCAQSMKHHVLYASYHEINLDRVIRPVLCHTGRGLLYDNDRISVHFEQLLTK